VVNEKKILANDKVYLQSITLETYSEWRREIPITNLLETINFCFKYGLFSSSVDVNDFPSDIITIDVTG